MESADEKAKVEMAIDPEGSQHAYWSQPVKKNFPRIFLALHQARPLGEWRSNWPYTRFVVWGSSMFTQESKLWRKED